MFRFLIVTIIALAALPAAAQDRASTPVERALALAVAQVAANEASLSRIRPVDVGLIWQVVTSHGETPHERLAWLRLHSSCVLTDREMTDFEAGSNCVWSRHLTASDRRPEGFPEHLGWSNFRERWRQVRELALQLVLGERTMTVCSEAPWTWGGRMDREHAERVGLRRLECHDPDGGRDPLNDGYALR